VTREKETFGEENFIKSKEQDEIEASKYDMPESNISPI